MISYLLTFARFVLRYEGKKAWAMSFALGVCATLALPPVYFLPLAVVGFVGHFWMLGLCQNWKQAFWTGWWFGFGHFVSGLYWISFALLTDIAAFGWLIPFAIFGIAAVVAFYPALVALGLFYVPHQGWRKVLAFACLWTGVEMLRGVLFTGFPWSLIGYVWTVSDSMLQLASITGIWGLSFLTILTFTLPATLVVVRSRRDIQPGSLTPSIVAASLLCLVWVGGALRLGLASDERVESVYLRIVQPNIEQDHKWDPDRRRAIVEHYLQLTRSKGFEAATHVIWPETALPYTIEEGSPLLEVVRLAVPSSGALIMGSLRDKRDEQGWQTGIWNSVHVINAQGKVVTYYDKHHLVPFGEYVPFRGILPMEKITHGMVDFSAGEGPQTLPVPDFPPMSPLVCYEAIFPGEVIDDSAPPPQVMVNVTNDGWYGNTSGPYQHFQMVRVRAVEEGIPMIRAANTGISGVVDSYGRVIAATKLGQTTTLDIYLPKYLPQYTIFSNLRSSTTLLLIVFCGLFLLFRREITQN